jgi:hypothetical protein
MLEKHSAGIGKFALYSSLITTLLKRIINVDISKLRPYRSDGVSFVFRRNLPPSIFKKEYLDISFLQNVGIYPPNYTTSHPVTA